MEIELDIKWSVCSEEFKRYVGRNPRDKEELEEYAHYIRKGIDAQLDWDILAQCAASNFKK